MSEYIDNQSKRQEALKRVIRQLHEGKSVDEVKAEFAALLEGMNATEIAALEQGVYKGTVEVSQDVAPIRALEGERRLLDEGRSAASP